MTTLTGQEARFLSGGEFPIPVPQGQNGTTIEFKEFGVGLAFLPVVLGGGVINVKLNISVSELVSANSVAVSSLGSTFDVLGSVAYQAQRRRRRRVEGRTDHRHRRADQRQPA